MTMTERKVIKAKGPAGAGQATGQRDPGLPGDGLQPGQLLSLCCGPAYVILRRYLPARGKALACLTQPKDLRGN
jgi:hypothetical protein